MTHFKRWQITCHLQRSSRRLGHVILSTQLFATRCTESLIKRFSAKPSADLNEKDRKGTAGPSRNPVDSNYPGATLIIQFLSKETQGAYQPHRINKVPKTRQLQGTHESRGAHQPQGAHQPSQAATSAPKRTPVQRNTPAPRTTPAPGTTCCRTRERKLHLFVSFRLDPLVAGCCVIWLI